MNTRKELYLYVTSQSSDDIYPNNDPSHFRLSLPQLIKLEGTWFISLVDIDLPKLKENYKPSYLVISSSACTPSFYENSLRPVLQRFYFGEVRSGRPLRFDPPRYVMVNSESIHSLEFRITDDEGEKPSFKPGKVSCTLHLRKETEQTLDLR